MNHIQVDHSERDKERRFKILEGCQWDLEKARKLLQWVEVGDIPPGMFKVSEALRTDEDAAP